MQLGGDVETGHHREFGRAFLEIRDDCGLFDGVWKKGEKHQVWMSHGDKITEIPTGFRAVGVSDGSPFAAIADDVRRIYAVPFHPAEIGSAACRGKSVSVRVHCGGRRIIKK